MKRKTTVKKESRDGQVSFDREDKKKTESEKQWVEWIGIEEQSLKSRGSFLTETEWKYCGIVSIWQKNERN